MIGKTRPASSPVRQEWSNDRGNMIVERRSPAVLVINLRGHPDGNMGTELAEWLEQQLQSPLVRHVFFEAEELVRYHSNVRTEPTRVLLQHRERLTIHVLVRSKIAQMGVAVANVAFSGELRGYKDRGEFLRELNAALANR